MTEAPNFSTRITEAEEMAKDAYATMKDACTDFAGDSYEQGEFEESIKFHEVGERLNGALEAFMTAAALARDYARREV
jgi:hypothetical protein